MIITVAAFKGGVGKTTSAVHLAAFMGEQGPTALIDGDPNRSATGWAKRGSLPFAVIDQRQALKVGRQYEHLIIDTQARPDEEDLRALAEGCDLLIVPTTPDALSLDALGLTVKALRALGGERYRILITMSPPRPNRDGELAREFIAEAGLPLFGTSIRRLVAFQRAASTGVLVQAVKDPRAGEGWHDYRRVGEEVLR